MTDDGDRADATERGEHYFTADPSVPFERIPTRVTVWGRELDLVSGSGVFAKGRLDIGTSVLFKETERPEPGHVLDLGCGYGVIGLAIARRWADAGVPVLSPEHPGGGAVTAIDVNERAVLLANQNAAALGVQDRFIATTPDQLPPLHFDEIWSNPPIRIGKAALHELLLRWLPLLKPGGRAVLVVGKNLGADSLQSWLTDQGFPTTRMASTKGFRVLESRRP